MYILLINLGGGLSGEANTINYSAVKIFILAKMY
jgi:hypothetical protein